MTPPTRKPAQWYVVRFLIGIVAIPLVAILAVPALLVMFVYHTGRIVMEEIR